MGCKSCPSHLVLHCKEKAAPNMAPVECSTSRGTFDFSIQLLTQRRIVGSSKEVD